MRKNGKLPSRKHPIFKSTKKGMKKIKIPKGGWKRRGQG